MRSSNIANECGFTIQGARIRPEEYRAIMNISHDDIHANIGVCFFIYILILPSVHDTIQASADSYCRARNRRVVGFIAESYPILHNGRG